jgi:ABC-type transport system involved in multi-copper enzyme maturation permease subunit
VSPLSEIRIVVERELRRNFRSLKGIVLAVLTLLGGSGIALLIAKINEVKREELANVSPEQMHEMREKLLTKVYGDSDMGHFLADAPDVLYGLLKLTVWLTPLLVALMGFDGIASDLQHKSVRYWTMRTRRPSYFIGKWLGLFLTVSIITLTMDAIIWIVSIVRGDSTAAATLSWGFRFWVISLPMSCAWCGIAMLISSMFRSPIIALLITFASFFTLWVLYIVGQFWSAAEFLSYVYPNHYDAFMLHPRAHKLIIGIGSCLGMAGLYVSAGSLAFAKRDV